MLRVTAAIITKNNKVLIAQRRQDGSLEGKWEFPGGKIEQDESPEDCLVRELHEEFGIDARIGSYFCSSIHDYKNFSIELIAYTIEDYSGDFVLTDHNKIEWVNFSELLDRDLSEADIPIAKRLIRKDLLL